MNEADAKKAAPHSVLFEPDNAPPRNSLILHNLPITAGNCRYVTDNPFKSAYFVFDC